jgi:alkylated DNA repair dioxygenase AlkB
MDSKILINEEGALVVLYPGWLRQYVEVDGLYSRFSQSPYFERPNIKVFNYSGPMPRDQIAIGDHSLDSHRYSGASIPMHRWEDMEEIRQIREYISECDELMELSRNSIPDSCLINYYRNGNDYVGYHSDAELKDESQTVYTISLGASRRFLLKHKSTKRVVEVKPQEGDLIIMTGTTQKFWKHSIPKTSLSRCPSGRISLTYRVI